MSDIRFRLTAKDDSAAVLAQFKRNLAGIDEQAELLRSTMADLFPKPGVLQAEALASMRALPPGQQLPDMGDLAGLQQIEPVDFQQLETDSTATFTLLRAEVAKTTVSMAPLAEALAELFPAPGELRTSALASMRAVPPGQRLTPLADVLNHQEIEPLDVQDLEADSAAAFQSVRAEIAKTTTAVAPLQKALADLFPAPGALQAEALASMRAVQPGQQLPTMAELLRPTNDELTQTNSLAKDLEAIFGRTFKKAVVGGNDLRGVLQGLGQDIALLALRKQVTEPLAGAITGGLKTDDLFGSLSGFFSNLFSFDGGGYTGSGARSGGLDGKGGFLSMLHPQETVTDHTKPGGARGASISYAPVINIDARADQGAVRATVGQALQENNKQFIALLQRQGVLAN